MDGYLTHIESLLEDSVRVVRGKEYNTPKKDAVDLFTCEGAYISPANQAQTPKPKRSYAKADAPSPYLPDPSAEKLAQSVEVTPALA